MVKFMNLIYFVFAVFIIGFAAAMLIGGSGKLWANICILLIGLYFLYRGIAVTVNNARRKERERLSERDRDNDPANA
ncbi:MAG: hypothetical protein J5907_01150 [Bacteroidales bacterium]|jgi:4-hydroxybenzoate polyprenyltransferase|nr:hypothetical protein [Bacteroidales bacterium]